MVTFEKKRELIKNSVEPIKKKISGLKNEIEKLEREQNSIENEVHKFQEDRGYGIIENVKVRVKKAEFNNPYIAIPADKEEERVFSMGDRIYLTFYKDNVLITHHSDKNPHTYGEVFIAEDEFAKLEPYLKEIPKKE